MTCSFSVCLVSSCSDTTSEQTQNWYLCFEALESFKACLNGSECWQPYHYNELLVDTLFEDMTASEITELQSWYPTCSIRTGFTQCLTGSPPRTNFSRTHALRRCAASRYRSQSGSYQRFYRGVYGKGVPLADMGDSCVILWWIKNHRPYQIFVLTLSELLEVASRMPA